MNSEFLEESDSSDEDYVPTDAGANGQVLSEVDSDGDPEEPLSDGGEEGNRAMKRKKKTTRQKKKAKTETEAVVVENTIQKEKTEEEKKKHADSLWASFKKDTGFKKKPPPRHDIAKPSEKKPVVSQIMNKEKAPEKIKVTQIFEFAGEEVKIEKEVAANSAEARLLSVPSGSAPEKPSSRTGLGGIGSVLGQIGKKQKLSTLEKTKIDWNKFKKEEKIEEELESYKKGKDGYLERQDFLQRADLRRFEIEKEIRTIERNKRLNAPQ